MGVDRYHAFVLIVIVTVVCVYMNMYIYVYTYWSTCVCIHIYIYLYMLFLGVGRYHTFFLIVIIMHTPICDMWCVVKPPHQPMSTKTALFFVFAMGWLWLVGSLKLQVSFAKEPYKRVDFLQKRPIFLRSLLIAAIPYILMLDMRSFFTRVAAVRSFLK